MDKLEISREQLIKYIKKHQPLYSSLDFYTCRIEELVIIKTQIELKIAAQNGSVIFST